jgi:hypothetical protein
MEGGGWLQQAEQPLVDGFHLDKENRCIKAVKGA